MLPKAGAFSALAGCLITCTHLEYRTAKNVDVDGVGNKFFLIFLS